MINDNVIAVINIEDMEYDYYTDEDRQFVELLAHHVASAIQRIENRKEYLASQQQLIEEQVKLERAKEMDDIKNRFISTATHEIRTPLTSIKGYAEIISSLLDLDSDDQIVEFFKVISRNIERLEHLTNDLLDIQRIESNRMTITIQETSIKTLINDVQREMVPLITNKNQEIKVNYKTESKTIPVDKLRIHQVLINLLQNASKYSQKETTITLTITEKPTEIEFNVTDQGHGINSEDLPKLFTAFPDIVYSDIQRGTGLGLAICKGIIDLHDGKIWAKSEGLGKGMSITFTLPKA
jgi:signal transduction histidine kinase